MITLNTKWTACHLGLTFPVGTVFIPLHPSRSGERRIWSYGTPDGGHGQVLLCKGVTPGVEA